MANFIAPQLDNFHFAFCRISSSRTSAGRWKIFRLHFLNGTQHFPLHETLFGVFPEEILVSHRVIRLECPAHPVFHLIKHQLASQITNFIFVSWIKISLQTLDGSLSKQDWRNYCTGKSDCDGKNHFTHVRWLMEVTLVSKKLLLLLILIDKNDLWMSEQKSTKLPRELKGALW